MMWCRTHFDMAQGRLRYAVPLRSAATQDAGRVADLGVDDAVQRRNEFQRYRCKVPSGLIAAACLGESRALGCLPSAPKQGSMLSRVLRYAAPLRFAATQDAVVGWNR